MGDLDTFDWDWEGRYGPAVIQELSASYLAYLDKEGYVPTQLMPTHALATRFAKARSGELLKLDGPSSMVRATREAVRDQVAISIRDGESLRTLKNRIRSSTGFSAYRAETIARTETARAQGQSSLVAFDSRGTAGKYWRLGSSSPDDGDPLGPCVANANAGPIPLHDGFPSGDQYPPAHPRCRCRIDPVHELPEAAQTHVDSAATGETAPEGLALLQPPTVFDEAQSQKVRDHLRPGTTDDKPAWSADAAKGISHQDESQRYKNEIEKKLQAELKGDKAWQEFLKRNAEGGPEHKKVVNEWNKAKQQLADSGGNKMTATGMSKEAYVDKYGTKWIDTPEGKAYWKNHQYLKLDGSKTPLFNSFHDMPQDVQIQWLNSKVYNTQNALMDKYPHIIDKFTHKVTTGSAESRLIHQWAISSADNNAVSVAMQRAVNEEFKLKASMGHLNPAALAKADAEYALNGAAYRSFVRAQYTITQRELKAAGIDQVTVFRGMRIPGVKTGNYVDDIVLQPASSFSLDWGTAQGFANDSFENKQKGTRLVVSSTIPRERILSTFRSGWGCTGEGELVVLGGTSDKSSVIATKGNIRLKRREALDSFLEAIL